jgi:hypothetical protein
MMIDTRRTVIGRLDSGYGPVLAEALRDVLSSPLSALRRPALIGHTASVPVVHTLEKFTKWNSVFAFDPRPEHVAYQRSKIKDPDRVTVLECRVTDLPPEVRDLSVVVNPFGLQEFPGEDRTYARVVRERAAADAVLLTLDWGPTRYPESIADLPGISDEVQFSKRSQLAPFGETEGWRLKDETSYDFFFVHTGEQVAAILPSAKAAVFREVVPADRIVEISSSVLLRRYEAAPVGF